MRAMGWGIDDLKISITILVGRWNLDTFRPCVYLWLRAVWFLGDGVVGVIIASVHGSGFGRDLDSSM